MRGPDTQALQKARLPFLNPAKCPATVVLQERYRVTGSVLNNLATSCPFWCVVFQKCGGNSCPGCVGISPSDSANERSTMRSPLVVSTLSSTRSTSTSEDTFFLHASNTERQKAGNAQQRAPHREHGTRLVLAVSEGTAAACSWANELLSAFSHYGCASDLQELPGRGAALLQWVVSEPSRPARARSVATVIMTSKDALLREKKKISTAYPKQIKSTLSHFITVACCPSLT